LAQLLCEVFTAMKIQVMVFRVKDRGKQKPSKTLVSYLITAQHQNPKTMTWVQLHCVAIVEGKDFSQAVITQSVQHWAMGWAIGILGFNSWQGLGIILFTTVFRTALGPTQPPLQWVPGALCLGVKWLGRETDHSPPSSAEVKGCVELYIYSPNTSSWRCA